MLPVASYRMKMQYDLWYRIVRSRLIRELERQVRDGFSLSVPGEFVPFLEATWKIRHLVVTSNSIEEIHVGSVSMKTFLDEQARIKLHIGEEILFGAVLGNTIQWVTITGKVGHCDLQHGLPKASGDVPDVPVHNR